MILRTADMPKTAATASTSQTASTITEFERAFSHAWILEGKRQIPALALVGDRLTFATCATTTNSTSVGPSTAR
jgi:hypothetical protein